MIGRKERKKKIQKKIQLHLWDSNPQPPAYMDKGTTTCAKGEPEVVGCCVALPCCLFDLACFFLPSFFHFSLKHVHVGSEF